MDSMAANSDSSWVRMDSMAGVRSEGVMEVNLGNSLDWRRGLLVVVAAVDDMLRRVVREAARLAETKARVVEGRVRSAARAGETIFIGRDGGVGWVCNTLCLFVRSLSEVSVVVRGGSLSRKKKLKEGKRCLNNTFHGSK